LDTSDGAGLWRKTDIQAVVTLSGVITYPGLERRLDALGLSRRYRLRIEAEFYSAWYLSIKANSFYRPTVDGFEFDAFPYTDLQPPENLQQIIATQPLTLFLTPRPNYQFPSHIPVARGVVKDSQGSLISDALVSRGLKEHVLTDSGGNFALPLRWVATNTVSIDAIDQRDNRIGNITIQFPQDLKKSQTILVQ
jgi:hypothetical protein